MEAADDRPPEQPSSGKRAGTLERGPAILDLLGATGPIGAGHVAEALGLSRSATYRILGTLRDFGYVGWDGAERVVLAHLRDLARELGESALPAIRDGDEMVYVAITDPARLRRELDAIRVRGHAVDDVENGPGVVCFGTAVRDHRGRPVCAISVAGPEQRMRAKREKGVSLVVEQALAISRRLGYAGTTPTGR